jgi:hypothetical protein
VKIDSDAAWAAFNAQRSAEGLGVSERDAFCALVEDAFERGRKMGRLSGFEAARSAAARVVDGVGRASYLIPLQRDGVPTDQVAEALIVFRRDATEAIRALQPEVKPWPADERRPGIDEANKAANKRLRDIHEEPR